MAFDFFLTVICLSITAGMCLLAVLSPAYDDTLFQRISLACLCLGSLGLAAWVYRAGESPSPLCWLSAWMALFALETARKYFAKAKAGHD